MTSSKHVDSAMVIKGLEAAAEEKPGLYKRGVGYGGCVNVEVVDGKRVPSCIVGTFIVNTLGIDVEAVDEFSSFRGTIHELMEDGWTFTPTAVRLLGIAQTLQDTGQVSWEVIAGHAAVIRNILDEDFTESIGGGIVSE